MNIHQFINEKPEEEFIAETEWLMDASKKEFEKAHSSMEKRYRSELKSFEAVLGKADFNEKSDNQLSSEVYFEAIKLSGWFIDDGLYFLAYVQHDKDTPVFVSCGYRDIKKHNKSFHRTGLQLLFKKLFRFSNN